MAAQVLFCMDEIKNLGNVVAPVSHGHETLRRPRHPAACGGRQCGSLQEGSSSTEDVHLRFSALCCQCQTSPLVGMPLLQHHALQQRNARLKRVSWLGSGYDPSPW